MKYLFSKKNLPNLLFWFLITANSLPILCNQYFLTLDGPAHLYNAKLVLQVLFENNKLLNSFYDFNTYPEPNLTGHVMMELLLTIIPPWLTEKTIQLLYVFGFPISFFYFLKSQCQNVGYKFIYFFPFIFAFTFIIGFYNYCISLILFFVCLSIWNSYCKSAEIKKLFLLSLFLFLLYFSHALVFLFCILTIIAIALSSFLNNKNKQQLKSQIITVTLVSLPGILFIATFFYTKREANQISYLSFKELINWIYTLKPVIAYGTEQLYLTTSLFFTYTISALLKLVFRFKNKSFKLNYKTDIFFFLFLLFGVLIFIIPDKFASGGFITMRIIMFTFFFLIIWICTQDHSKWIEKFSVPLVFVLYAALSISHFNHYSKLNSEVQDQQSCLNLIKPNSTLLPLNYSKHWLQSNMSNYLGTQFPLLILDNYEATQKPFQLHWKVNRDPHKLIGEFAGHPPLCADIPNFEDVTGKSIDYIITWKKPNDMKDSCTFDLENYISLNYDTLYVSQMNYLYLFQKKENKSTLN